MIVGLGKNIHKMKLDHFVLPENKEKLKQTQKLKSKECIMTSKGHRNQMNEFSVTKAGRI
jgi:hypothetical protein